MAKLRGVKFGRPRIALPNGYERIAGKFLNGEITSDEACAYLKMSRGTFFRNLTAKRIKKQP
jgi:hypothetical protein